MERRIVFGSLLFVFFMIFFYFSAYSASCDPCCPLTKELRYLLQPPSEAEFRYQVRHEVFFSSSLGKEKNFFIILPPDFDPDSSARYPLLILLHGYNLQRNRLGRSACDPAVARDLLCRAEHEEYHWLLLEDSAPIAAAMMDVRNKSYQDLQDDLKMRFQELATYGGLREEDYEPSQIATSLVEHNLHPKGGLDVPFQPIYKMIIVLPDGDNSFYTDEDEGKSLFPFTRNKGSCDAFLPDECLRISPALRRYMKPGALGKYESYILELMEYLRNKSSLKGRILPPPHTGIGGFSMGGFGALKIALRHPGLFSSVSSQSGLVDIELLTNKMILKTTMPEFLEVFGSLAPLALPTSSIINEPYLREHNPVRLISEGQGNGLWDRIYFDYGARESFDAIREGNERLEKVLGVTGHIISVQQYNGKAEHNYLLWRSRMGAVLEHHSKYLR